MSEMIRRLFPGNNSTQGFYSYYPQCLAGAEQIYILKGGPGTGKSSLMKRLSERLQREGLKTEHWLCSSDPESLDGIFLPERKIAVVDGTAPHVVEPQYPGVVENLVNLGDCWDKVSLWQKKDRIKVLTNRITAAFAEAYRYTAEVGKIEVLLRILQSENSDTVLPMKLPLPKINGGIGELKQYFAMAMTPLGVIDLREDLCADYKNRFFLVGSRCDCRSDILKTIAESALHFKVGCEIGYGPFEPCEPVAVLLPSLSAAMIAVEALPTDLRQEDRVIVFDGKKSRAICAAEQKRKDAIENSTMSLAEAHRLHDELEAIYIEAMDYAKVERLEKSIYQNILNFTAKS